jgi:hypothetical protein
MQNSYDTTCDAQDALFDKLCLLSDAKAENFGNPKCYHCKDPGKKKTRTECYNMEPNHTVQYHKCLLPDIGTMIAKYISLNIIRLLR